MRRLLGRRLSAAITLAGLGWLGCIALVYAWSHRVASGTADAIVVLGAAQYAGRPSPVLRARLDHAYMLWETRRAPWVLLTGGRGTGDVESEAEAGRRYLMRRGIPARAILMETEGRTTLASLRAADAQLRARAIPATGRARVLLVSDPFHMLRLELLSRLHGLVPLPSPTPTSPISANRTVALEYMLRESVAVPADLVLMALPAGFLDR
jgi:uncharacterized SAM-binding protein YcdF (DUF218 family)